MFVMKLLKPLHLSCFKLSFLMFSNNSPPENFTIIENSSFLDRHFCQQVLYQSIEINNSSVRWWDISLVVPNSIFAAFLLYGLRTALRRLNQIPGPISVVFYSLVWVVCGVSIGRAIIGISVGGSVKDSSAVVSTDKSLWLVLRFLLLATETSVLVFAVGSSRLSSKETIRRVFLCTCLFAGSLTGIQSVFEFTTYHNDKEFAFMHGGILFFCISSFVIALVYLGILGLRAFSPARQGVSIALPERSGFYRYVATLFVLYFLAAIGSFLASMNIPAGYCIIDVTSFLYYGFYAALVYFTFLWNLLRLKLPAFLMFAYASAEDVAGADTIVPSDDERPEDNLDTQKQSKQVDNFNWIHTVRPFGRLPGSNDYLKSPLNQDEKDDPTLVAHEIDLENRNRAGFNRFPSVSGTDVLSTGVDEDHNMSGSLVIDDVQIIPPGPRAR